MFHTNRWPVVVVSLAFGLLGGLLASEQLIGQPVAQRNPPLNPPTFPRDWHSYSPIVKRVLPAVVSIEDSGKADQPKPADGDPGFGSGVLIDPAGIVLTNHHVVAASTALEVTLHDGRKFASKDIRRDPKTDLAIIRLNDNDPFPFLEFGDSDAMEIGDRVLALGAPFGLTGSVTQGIVSAKSRKNLNLNLYEDFLQIDAAVNPGNSGGPLVNMEGKLIGLTSAIKTRNGGFQGVGLAVSSKLAKTIAMELIQKGAVRRPYLGILVDNLDPETAAKLKLNAGVRITQVVEKSPGAAANLGVGDVITQVNQKAIKTPRELQEALLAVPVGKAVELRVVRNGQLFVTRPVVEQQPEVLVPEAKKQNAATIDFNAVGVTVVDVTPQLAGQLGLKADVKGVFVTRVTQNGLAAKSGVKERMLVVQVDQTPVTSADEFRSAVENATREQGAILHVLQPNGNIEFFVLKGQ